MIRFRFPSAVPTAIVLLAVLVCSPFVVNGFYNIPSADDYWCAVEQRTFWPSYFKMMAGHSGRFTQNLLVLLPGEYDLDLYRLLPLLVLGVLFALRWESGHYVERCR